MKVLGLSPLDKDSTVTIVEDGVITYAAAEERFTRVKLQSGFPTQALQDAFDRTGTMPDDIDCVAYPFFTWEEETRLFQRNLAKERDFLSEADDTRTAAMLKEAAARVPTRTAVIPGLRDPNEKMEKGLAKSLAYRLLASDGVVSRNVAKRESEKWGREASTYHRQWQEELESALEEIGLRGKLKRVEHHLSHSANAYYNSGFDNALIVTLDGYGSGLAGSVSEGRNGRIKRINDVEYPHSLGTFYESVTSGLGFQPSRHEGKIVGLAAYGDPAVLKHVLLARFDQQPGTFRILQSNNLFFARMLAGEFPKIDVAAAYQHVLEIVATAYVSHHLKATGLRNVVMSGGVCANVKLNQRIREIPGVEKIFIHPNMGDGGCGTGAAQLEFVGNPRLMEPLPNVFLGPSYTDDQIMDALQRAQLQGDRYTPIEPKIAALIAAGKVVARFNGRMEYGPRALGNRTIMYHAKEPEVNQWLNQRLGRTEFMPFAPATLYEKRHECYRNMDGAEYAAQFMTITFDCTDFMRKNSPAAVHVDGTARPQLVTETSNPSFYRVLTEYHKLSGIPSVINTSFNMHEEPIVCTPDDAVRAFLQGNLDYLAIGDFLVAHPSAGDDCLGGPTTMRVLGVSGRRLNAAAALSVDGVIVAASSEGCLLGAQGIGYRATGGFPFAAARLCLQLAGQRVDDLDAVAIVRDQRWDASPAFENVAPRRLSPTDQQDEILAASLKGRRWAAVTASAAAAAQAAAMAPDDAVVLAADLDAGAVLYEKRAARLCAPTAIEESQNLKTIVELAARALNVPMTTALEELLRLASDDVNSAPPQLAGVVTSLHDGARLAVDAGKWSALIERADQAADGRLRDAASPHVDVQRARRAIAAQLVWSLIGAMAELIDNAARTRALDTIALGGGFFAHAALNTALIRRVTRNVVLSATPEPDGLAIGAALAVDDARPQALIGSLALGAGFTVHDVKAALENCRLDYVYEPDWRALLERASSLLSRGKLVAWAHGRRDFGRRSLGSRCVLADPSQRFARDNVNHYLLGRSLDHPLTVSMTENAARSHLQDGRLSPHALLCGQPAPGRSKAFVSVMNADGAFPLQTVNRESAPELTDLLELHESRTGTPGLIQVGLDDVGAGPVCSPRDAIRSAFSSAVDALVIGRFLVMKDYWLLRSSLT